MKTGTCFTSLLGKTFITLLAVSAVAALWCQPGHAFFYEPFQQAPGTSGSADLSGLSYQTSIPGEPSAVGAYISGNETYTLSTTGTLTVGYQYSGILMKLTAGTYNMSAYFNDYISADNGNITLTGVTLTSTVDGQSVQAVYDGSAGLPLWVTGSKSGLLTVSSTDYYSLTQTFLATFDVGQAGTISITAPDTTSISSVPIPSALLLFAPGLAGLAALRRKFRK
jgi:hypothetical protein